MSSYGPPDEYPPQYGQPPYPPGYPPPQGYPPTQGYPPPQGYPPGYPPPGLPPPQRPRRRHTGLIIGLVVGALVLLCCCGGLYAAYQWGGSILARAVTGGNDKPVGRPGDAGMPTDPNDAAYASVGDCVVDAPTATFPEQMAKAPCSTSGAYKVKNRYNGITDTDRCPGNDATYVEDLDGTDHDFLLCIDEV